MFVEYLDKGFSVKHLIILGNGFSIDLLRHIDKFEDYPLTNLLSYGDKLRWPASDCNAFISFRHTPNLWLLGVRSNNSAERNMQIVENIITCANAIQMKKREITPAAPVSVGDVYLNAYKELVSFLKFLFIQFDQEITISNDCLSGWHWADLLKKLDDDEDVTQVDIITFNYDLWMERVLEALNIDYKTTVIENAGGGKFSITKPHGSISFVHSKSRDVASFNINYSNEIEILEGVESDFTLEMDDLKKHSPITPLIPPAGDSSRYQLTWAGKLKAEAENKAKGIEDGDKVILCGLSYWHVDRKEIDEILLNLTSQCELAYINPSPPAALDAVLTSLFKNYEHYVSAERYAGGQK